MSTRFAGSWHAVAGFALALVAAGAIAQQPGKPAPEIRMLNWGKWQERVGFSQAASVKNAGRWLFLAGAGSEEEQEGNIQHPGDFMAQCRYAWNTIKRVLEREGAGPRNIVRVVTYVTDPRSLRDNNACKKEVFGNGPYPLEQRTGFRCRLNDRRADDPRP